MKKLLVSLFIFAVLALDWVALDDITTGIEPNYTGEYLILILSLLIFGFMEYYFYKRKDIKSH